MTKTPSLRFLRQRCCLVRTRGSQLTPAVATRIILCWLVLVGIGCNSGSRRSVGWQPTDKELNELFDEYSAAIKAEKRELAVACLTRLIQGDPANAGGYYGLRAPAYFAMGEIDQAFDDASEAIRLSPPPQTAAQRDSYADFHYLRGKIHSLRGEYEEAGLEFTRTIEYQPRNAFAYSERAFVQLQLGNNADAVTDATSAIEILDSDALPYHHRALAHARMADYEKAISDWEAAIARWNNGPVTYDALAGAGFCAHLADLLATCSVERFRDGSRALKLAMDGLELGGDKDALTMGAIAASHAELGDLDAAVRWQQKVLQLPLQPAVRPNHEQRLQAYQSGKAYRRSDVPPAEATSPLKGE